MDCANSQSSLDQPHLMVMPDVEDAFVPMQDDFFVDPMESRLYLKVAKTKLQSANRDTSVANGVYVQ